MESGVILISAVRYLHATHDIELDFSASDIVEQLQKAMQELNDGVLDEYLQEYAQSVNQ